MPDLSTAAPVFVDPTGKRRKHVRTTAVLSVAALVAVGGLLVAALFGAPLGPTASLPIPPPSAPAQPVPVETTAERVNPTSRTKTSATPTSTTTKTAQPTTTRASSSAAVTTTKPGNTPPGRPSDLPRPTKPPR